MTDLPLNVGHVVKNSREQIRVSLTEYRGYKLCDARVYAVEGENATPTKAGLSIRLSALPAVIALLQEAEKAARNLGLLDDGGAE